MWDLNYKHLHIWFTMHIALFRVIWAVFAFLLFLDAFPFDLTLSITSISPQFDGIRLQLENLPRIQWAIFVASRSRGANPVFHWSGA